MVNEPLYTFDSPVDSRFKRKLQSIFSLVLKTSLLHFLVFTKSLSAVCRLVKVCLSTVLFTRLLTTLTLARNSCAWLSLAKNNKKKNRKYLFIFILNNDVYNIFSNFFFRFDRKPVFLITFIKNRNLVSVKPESRTFVIH